MPSNKYRYELVKQHIDGLQYISQSTRLKKVGQLYRGNCPFHNEKTPSFHVFPKGYYNPHTKLKQDYESFYCFGCGVGGDIIEFKKLKENCETRMDACELLEKEIGLVVDNDTAQFNYVQEQINKIKNSQGHTLSLTEINLICSSICRNYLLWVKENFANKYEDEIKTIDKFYKYFDNTLQERTSFEAMSLVDEVKEKIEKRRLSIKED